MKYTGNRTLRIAVAMAFLLAASHGPFLEAQDKPGTQQSIVQVHAEIPPGATTARTLGTEREGNGILIDANGLILTIGYLILEADKVEVQTASGSFPARFVGYDADTGFGLVRASGLTGVKPMEMGDSSQVQVGDTLQVKGFGQNDQSVSVISRDPFVGYWEYLVESAIYAAPAFPDYGGAALVRDGKLVGVGSILASFSVPGMGRVSCNMFVPVELLKPILADMVRTGHSGSPAHPWLGVNTAETEGRVVVTLVTPGSPADQAGLKPGDIILSVGQQQISSIADFYRQVWATGPAGVSVSLRVLQGDNIHVLSVKSADRARLLRQQPAAPDVLPSGSSA